MSILAAPSVPTLLAALAADGNTGLYCRAIIYDSTNAVVAQPTLTHVAGGMYTTTYSFASEGSYNVVYQFFTDAGFTSPSGYDKGMDAIDVSSFKANITRVLGLLHENTVIDQYIYNGSGQATSMRVRAYNSKTNADLAGATGLLYTWTVSATYSVGVLATFKITLNP